ncbi:TetR/AcrR family transcriptional regulator [Rhizobium sp. P44RR-XXIV]|uniref:TetR/AcrR family transcriptional regulator n=1 Tax=Rhizobium sp. P44RR-XXIV TaxID=1921145 RepID=UPI000985AEDC|nr:TetR/AcrR family transcriptional regulator [Rhizobium sp. P44RR-XXIV]TIX87652.1 TetR/AcrR family transcriptional regulator [Rhizobium sp. P44RR-XXIV]
MNVQDTREMIMEAARLMVQDRGYNALSFRDVAAAVGVKSASVHYHFPTKGDLGAALARRYTDVAAAFLNSLLDEPIDIHECFAKYTAVFRAALEKDNRMCLCGIMSAEYVDLPDAVRVEVDRFAEVNIDWLTKVLSRHRPRATAAEKQSLATAIFAAIEGAQLVARGRGDIAIFDQCIKAYRSSGLSP